jgi:hypothetical protein
MIYDSPARFVHQNGISGGIRNLKAYSVGHEAPVMRLLHSSPGRHVGLIRAVLLRVNNAILRNPRHSLYGSQSSLSKTLAVADVSLFASSESLQILEEMKTDEMIELFRQSNIHIRCIRKLKVIRTRKSESFLILTRDATDLSRG